MVLVEITDYEDLTKYEKARVIGARALQLDLGAPPLITVPEGTADSIALAKEEFRRRVIPLIVLREKRQ